MHGLVVVVPPPPHLPGELHGRCAVYDDKGVTFPDRGCGQLQERADEVGERHAEAFGERLRAGDLIFGHAHVDLLGVSLHRVGRSLLPSWVSKEAQPTLSGARGIPRKERSRARRGVRCRRAVSGRFVLITMPPETCMNRAFRRECTRRPRAIPWTVYTE